MIWAQTLRFNEGRCDSRISGIESVGIKIIGSKKAVGMKIERYVALFYNKD